MNKTSVTNESQFQIKNITIQRYKDYLTSQLDMTTHMQDKKMKNIVNDGLINYHSASVHVTNISSDTRSIDNIIKMKNRDRRIHLHKHRKRLANSSSSTQYSDFEPWCPSFRSAISSLQNTAFLCLLKHKPQIFLNKKKYLTFLKIIYRDMNI